jgi:hypothetical protein
VYITVGIRTADIEGRYFEFGLEESDDGLKSVVLHFVIQMCTKAK